VKTYWPSGIEDIYFNVPVNTTIDIAEGDEILDIDDSTIKINTGYPNPIKVTLTIKSNRTVN
jgi:hypothetical protein